MSSNQQESLVSHFKALLAAASRGDLKMMSREQAALLRRGVAVRVACDDE